MILKNLMRITYKHLHFVNSWKVVNGKKRSDIVSLQILATRRVINFAIFAYVLVSKAVLQAVGIYAFRVRIGP